MYVLTTTRPQITPLLGHCQMSLTSIERYSEILEKLKFKIALTNCKMEKLLNSSINERAPFKESKPARFIICNSHIMSINNLCIV